MDSYGSRRQRRASSPASRVVWLSRFAIAVFVGLLLCIIGLFFLFVWYGRDLPTPGKLVNADLSESTRIFDRKGELLYDVHDQNKENRIYVRLQDVPKDLQHATVAVEDKNFYTNPGFSTISYLRVIKDIILYHRVTGGSGLTQQLVKNVLLSSERTLPRKIKELMLSIQVDKKYTKDQILEMYLNDVPYGGNNLGVEAAAEYYFGKHVNELDVAESAFLAGMPQGPTLYSPYSGHRYYVARTQEVLTQMVRNNYISQKQADSALTEIKNKSFSSTKATIMKAPWFTELVKEELVKKFGDQLVEAGGLQVTTTLDYAIEKKAEDIVSEELDKIKNYHVANGAAIVSDPKTGEILAMVGNKDFNDKSIDGNYNDAVANRQPGSSLKPVIYATAFNKGYTSATLLMDVKTDFPTNDPTQPIYTPVNYDGKFRGPVQVRFALGNSLNIPAVKMLAKVGIKDVLQQGYEMGIQSWQPTSDTMSHVGLSLVLGGRETSLLNEVTAYSVFANQGIRQDSLMILKVTDSHGKILYENHKTEGRKVLSPEVCFLISHILLDNNAREGAFGTSSYLVIPGKTVSVKTGTTDQKRDNWTIGYTPSYVVGVWVGNNDNTPMNQAIASGVTGASPIWNKIMSYVLKGKPDEQPQKPEGVIALEIDSLGGGLPHGGQPTRSEYFINGTQPTAEAPIYKSKDGKNYLLFRENDPVSTDGTNRWQKGIDDWINSAHKDEEMYHPPDDVINPKKEEEHKDGETPTPTSSPSPTP